MSGAWSIRVARADDAAAVHALVESAYRGASARQGWTHEADMLGGQRTDRQTLDAILRNPGQRLLVAERKGRLEGCVCVTDLAADSDATDNGAGVCELGMLAVDPGRQAGGLGRQLIAAAEQTARSDFAAASMEMTVIHSRRELIGWYQRRGYADTGRRKPFPVHDPRFGVPKVDDLHFVVLARRL